MEVVKLTPGFAEKIHELELAVYPPQFIAGPGTIRENLTGAERDEENLSWGVVEDEKLLAYLMAWVDSSMVEGREYEDVVFVDDIAVLPGQQNAFFLLLSAMTEDIASHNLGTLPIEGTTRVPSFKIFSRHEKIFQSLGYQLTASHEYYDEELSEQMIWVRFDVARKQDNAGEPEAPMESLEEGNDKV
jgi:hypothetical protein